MKFPNLDAVGLPVHFEQIRPGKLHADGRRYLPVLLLHTVQGQLGVVDRHHRVDPALVGRAGTARLVCALSRLRLQPDGNQRQGFELAPANQRASLEPVIYGQISAMFTWEQHTKLGYESLYTELLLDVGIGTVGVRTNITGVQLADVLGAARLDVGDWVMIDRSRIDILAFVPNATGG